jgi:hypothetical protein
VILAQQRTSIGLNLTTNIDQFSNIEPETGILFERQINSHSGFEAGINYRTYRQEFMVLINNQASYLYIREMFLSVPVSYKFYSKIVNLGVGISFDYFLDWKQLRGTPEMTSYWPGSDYFIGALGKISREIPLGDNFSIEPEVKFNLIIIPSLRHYLGFGLVSRFNLHKPE